MAEDMKTKPDSYWKDKLTPEQYHVLREKGTEAPGSGKYVDHDEAGMYTCAACGHELFSSADKFESTTPGLEGWPGFSAAAAKGNIELKEDNSWGMHRTEITCSHCGSHLGHLFENDPGSPNGTHYCVNSCTLDFKPKGSK